MKQHELLNSISKYFSRFSEQVTILNKNSEFSINIHAENILIKILNIVFECNLENVNYVEGKNYDSIDLRDKKQRISFQITATSKIVKIKTTLSKFLTNKHYENFDTLKILILTGRQERYNIDKVTNFKNSTFSFNQSTDVIDFSTLYLLINKLNDVGKILVINELLSSQFSDIQSKNASHTINSFKSLCIAINPYFKENHRIFLKYGPNSGRSALGPVRWDLSLWYKARREKLVPNNSFAVALIKEHKHFIPIKYINLFEEFIYHAFAFEKHCEDSDFDYSQYLFPTDISNIIDSET